MTRRICFVTGTRAEFGLMRSVLQAIKHHPALQLQLVVTGMHLQSRHGRSIDTIRKDGWKIDAIVPWKSTANLAAETGDAIAGMAKTIAKLKSDVVLIVGDRVEAFAAASAGFISQKIVAHVHGGDRAPGQIDDSLRHAITKLSQVHFPATPNSAKRLIRLGEDRWRIHQVGSPGIDGIADAASPTIFSDLIPHRYALVVIHPVDSSAKTEYQRAAMTLRAIHRAGIDQTVVIYPNNDPGCQGIIKCWNDHRSRITHLLKDTTRPDFLALMKNAAVLVGNSSSGIIEAASFGTPVTNIGPRQFGRDRSQNVTDAPYSQTLIHKSVQKIWNHGNPRRWHGRNAYGGHGTGRRMADILASIALDQRLRRKLIAY